MDAAGMRTAAEAGGVRSWPAGRLAGAGAPDRVGRSRVAYALDLAEPAPVRGNMDYKACPKGARVSDADMAALNSSHDPFHWERNYTIKPNGPADGAVAS